MGVDFILAFTIDIDLTDDAHLHGFMSKYCVCRLKISFPCSSRTRLREVLSVSSVLCNLNHWFGQRLVCSINTVYYMAPYATMILALPALLLEGWGVVTWFNTQPSLFVPVLIIFLSGVSAFCLNFSIFYVIHATTAVTFNVAGNMKVRLLLEILSCSFTYGEHEQFNFFAVVPDYLEYFVGVICQIHTY